MNNENVQLVSLQFNYYIICLPWSLLEWEFNYHLCALGKIRINKYVCIHRFFIAGSVARQLFGNLKLFSRNLSKIIGAARGNIENDPPDEREKIFGENDVISQSDRILKIFRNNDNNKCKRIFPVASYWWKIKNFSQSSNVLWVLVP